MLTRRSRLLWLVLVSAVALAPATVMAADPIAFQASGHLVQTSAGISELTVSSGLPGGFPDGVPGRLTTAQAFMGHFTSGDWGSLVGTQIEVNPHNSFITFLDGELDFAGGVESIVGVTYGDMILGSEPAHMLAGNYVANITGVLLADPSCPIDPVLGVPARVEITDSGGWTAFARSGLFETVVPEGGLVVTATGCLGSETAIVTVQGKRVAHALGPDPLMTAIAGLVGGVLGGWYLLSRKRNETVS